MIIQKPQILVPENNLNINITKRVERYARVCYKSEEKFSADLDNDFLSLTIERGHESVIEHEKMTVLFIVDRGISHEIVRHRIGSYSQESTRYCNYMKGKFGGEVSFIEPFFLKGKVTFNIWKEACTDAEKNYFKLIENNCTPQEARSVLTNSLKTEIVVTYNFREWRHFLRLRCAPEAHPQMRQVTIPLLILFRKFFPTFFDDIPFDNNFDCQDYGEIKITDEFFIPKV